MTPQHPTFETFYDDQVAAHRQLYSRDTISDRLSQPTILVSIVILAVTVGYNLYGSSATLEGTISLLATCLWDALVLLIPESFLNATDDWINPSPASRPMLHPGQSGHAAKSETMKRILGLDRSGGMMASVFQARSRALSMTGSVLGLKVDSDRPAGLGNRDNSCYQNSILQGLASLKPLPEYLSAYLQASEGEDGDRDVAQTLRTLIADLNDGSNNGRTLWTPSLLKSMSTWTQQDAQEYFSKILDDIDKSVAKAMKSMQQQHPGLQANIAKDDTAASQHSDDSGYQSLSSSKGSDTKPPRNPLEGLLAQRVACVQCGHSDGLSMIPFTCLTLSLGLNKNQHDLYERLDAYSKVESIENVECAKCTLLKAQRLLNKLVERLREGSMAEEQLAEPIRRLKAVEQALEEDEFDEKTLTEKCKISQQSKVSSTKTKQIVVARPPQSLAVHMNRSVFDPMTFNMMKNSAPVNFPMTLDLGPWCLGSAGTITATTSDSDTEEQWLSDPRESMIAGDLNPSKLTGPIYELRAVVTHYGRHENGHYICYRKHPRHTPPTFADDNKGSVEPGEKDDSITTQPDARVSELGKEKGSGEVEMDWWRLSDHNVSVVDEQTVLSLSPGVFMLFYDCVDPNTVLTAEDRPMHDAREEADTTAQGYGTEGGDGSAACENGTKTALADRTVDGQQQAEAETATETPGFGSTAVNTATTEETEAPDIGSVAAVETLHSAEEDEARTTRGMTSQ